MAQLGDTLVLGMGRSGTAAARYLAALVASGEARSVTLVDSNDSAELRESAEPLASSGVTVALGCNEVSGHYDLCVASPGIKPSAPLMVSARDACDTVVSEIEFAFSRSDHTWVAITGTNGKTTTTALVAHLLTAAGVRALPVGNIGAPAIAAVADAPSDEILIAEVSSFQLAGTVAFHPRVAVLLNITPDHIDWHGSLESYAADKTRVFSNLEPGDTAVIDVDDPGAAPYAAVVEASGVEVVRVSRGHANEGGANAVDGWLTLETRAGSVRLLPVADLPILGPHNVSNALAAAAAVHALGVQPGRIASGLRTFRAIEHRLELVGVARGVEWFNDSKATNPDAVFKALDAFGDRPLIVLLGGRNKGNDFLPLARAVSARAKAAVVFGESAGELQTAFDGLAMTPVRVGGLREAVAAADGIAGEGDVVVLSPACASFDEFDSYEHRGAAFKAFVLGMMAGGHR